MKSMSAATPTPGTRLQPPRAAALLWTFMIILTAALFAYVIVQRPKLPSIVAGSTTLDDIVLWHSIVPRFVTALLCGAALGLSGAILQRVLRNPIADASTLGIASGAQLALTFSTVFAPALLVLSREGVALAGGISAAFIVLGLSFRKGLDPVTVVLSGMVVSLIAAAISATMVLMNGEYVLSLYVWGSGALHQQSWDTAVHLAPRLFAGCLAAAVLIRPLTLLGLDDAGARSLGLAVHGARLLAMGVAIWLAAAVTAYVGVLAFVGLAAPAVARVTGRSSAKRSLIVSPVAGALLLGMTDSAVQILGTASTDLAPTGAATALLGGPLLLWLLPRVKLNHAPAGGLPIVHRRIARPWRACAGLIVLAAFTGAFALAVGQGPYGWSAAIDRDWFELLPFRAPRILVAAAAGAMLGAAGTLMQRLTGNPLAGPEVLGVSAGGGVGLAAVLYLFPEPTPGVFMAGVALGSLGAMVLVMLLSGRAGAAPQRLLLAGIAVGAFCMAIVSTALAQADMRAYALLAWLSGSTNGAGDREVWLATAACLILIPPLFLLSRWLDILPLGRQASRSLGLPESRARIMLAGLAGILAALSSLLIGPLSLVGLIAPHLARLLGFARGRHQLAASVLLGCTIMIAADWCSRVIAFPYQIPVGLFASVIGGSFLVWLLSRGETSHA